MATLNRRSWVHDGNERHSWQVRWKDETGKRRGRQFASRTAAVAFLSKFHNGCANPADLEPKTATIAVVAREYLKWTAERYHDGRIGYSTLKKTEGDIHLHIIGKIGHLHIDRLTMVALVNWHRGLVGEGGLSANVARDIAQRLKSIVDFAIRRDWTEKNHVSGLMIELRGIPKSTIRTFGVEELKLLIAASSIRPKGKHYRPSAMLDCFVNIAAFCGLRRGEIGGLTMDDIDLVGGIVHVRRNLTEYKELKVPKSAAGVRSVPMPEHVVRMLSEWVRDFYIRNKRRLLFASRSGGPLQLSTLAPLWYDLLDRAALNSAPKYHFHALRHFAASLMLKNGWPIVDVSGMLGHAQVSMTLDVYSHSVTDRSEYKPAMQMLARQIVGDGTDHQVTAPALVNTRLELLNG